MLIISYNLTQPNVVTLFPNTDKYCFVTVFCKNACCFRDRTRKQKFDVCAVRGGLVRTAFERGTGGVQLYVEKFENWRDSSQYDIETDSISIATDMPGVTVRYVEIMTHEIMLMIIREE